MRYIDVCTNHIEKIYYHIHITVLINRSFKQYIKTFSNISRFERTKRVNGRTKYSHRFYIGDVLLLN